MPEITCTADPRVRAYGDLHADLRYRDNVDVSSSSTRRSRNRLRSGIRMRVAENNSRFSRFAQTPGPSRIIKPSAFLPFLRFLVPLTRRNAASFSAFIMHADDKRRLYGSAYARRVSIFSRKAISPPLFAITYKYSLSLSLSLSYFSFCDKRVTLDIFLALTRCRDPSFACGAKSAAPRFIPAPRQRNTRKGIAARNEREQT